MATLIGKIYNYLKYANESDHHPSYEGGVFTISETINKNTAMELKWGGRVTWAYPYGTRTSNAGFYCTVNSMGSMSINYFGATAVDAGFSDSSGVIYYNKNKVYLNGTLQKTMSVPSSSATGIKLVCSRYGDSANAQNIYYVKIWQNGVLTRDIVPMVSNSKNGLYDKVSHTFWQSNRTCTPTTFVKDYYKYTISVSTSGSGTGTATGGGTYYTDNSVSLTATPGSGAEFLGWYSGTTLVSSSNPYTFTASSDRSLTAKFGLVSNVRYKVNGEWKVAKMYKKVNGSWVTGVVRIKQNGSWSG